MPSIVLSAATLGIDAYPVHVEVDTDRSLPTFTVVGLPDSVVRESKGARLSSHQKRRLSVAAPQDHHQSRAADRKKEGSAFDLPIAVGVLAASQQIKPVCLAEFALLGELSLNGSVRPVHGMLPMATSLHQQGLYGMIVPTQNAREAAIANGPLIYGVSSLNEALAILTGDARQRPYELNVEELFSSNANYGVDFCGSARPRSRQARPRSRRQWGAQFAHGRAAWVGQDHARPPPTHDPPGTDPARGARHHQDSFGRRDPCPRPSPSRHPALPRPAPHHLGRRSHRRRRVSPPGRGVALPPRRALSRRAARISPQRRRGPASAARRPHRHHHPGADLARPIRRTLPSSRR